MSFVSETQVRAVRKRHACCACGRSIEIGEPATRWSGTTDGDFSAVIYHRDCRAAEIALNRLHGNHWDEWFGLHEINEDDRDWLCEEHPTVAARFGWSIYDWREPRLSYFGWFGGDPFYWQSPQ